MFIPAHLAPHTVESLYAEHGRERPWVYSLLLLMVVAGLISLPLVTLDVSVEARGVVRPAVERVPLRAARAGRIAEVLVRDNAFVQAGEVVFRLRTDEVDERLARNLALQAERKATLEDCARAIGWIETGEVATAPPDFSGPVWRQEVVQVTTQRLSARLAEDRARGEAARLEVLAAKGIVAARDRDNARYEVRRLEAESQLLADQALTRWHTLLRQEGDALAELVSLARLLEEERAEAVIRSPARGVLMGLNGCEPGVYVAATQELGAVSPEEPLVIETYVSPRDIGLIRLGQRARLQIDAYPYATWGVAEGVVRAVGNDWAESGGAGGAPSFRVSIAPETTALFLSNGARGELKKGLTLSARFVIGRRSVLQLLREESSRWLDPKYAQET